MLQMMMQNKIQQIPQQMMTQLEKNLKARNPQAFQKYQEAKKNNNPNDLLNETINNFTPQQKQQWEQMMQMFNGINTQK
jgi:hypothetical protein